MESSGAGWKVVGCDLGAMGQQESFVAEVVLAMGQQESFIAQVVIAMEY